MNLAAIRSFRPQPVEHSYTTRDTILYALGLGYGSNPVDLAELKFVYEDGLQAVPSLCCVLAHPGFWARDPALEIDWLKLLHGEHHFEIHHPIAPQGTVVGTYEIVAVEDKGAAKGAILHHVKRLHDKPSGKLLATIKTFMFMRGDGGCGGFGEIPPPPAALPDQEPAKSCTLATLPQSALIYRLSGDYNPIHADPAAAAKAGFQRPILHGLCTLGMATRALLSTFADNDAKRLKSLFVRFSKPVLPGETITTEFFPSGNQIRFRARVTEHDALVLDRCTAVLV